MYIGVCKRCGRLFLAQTKTSIFEQIYDHFIKSHNIVLPSPPPPRLRGWETTLYRVVWVRGDEFMDRLIFQYPNYPAFKRMIYMLQHSIIKP